MAKAQINQNEFEPFSAPDFTLPSSKGGEVTLRELNGQWVVLFFYPKDNTEGCTIEAQEFSDLAGEFKTLDTALYGISKDSLKKHANFIKKFDLDLELLADESTETIQAYGLWAEKTLYGKKYMGTERATFLIDPNGMVRKAWRNVKVSGHAAEVLLALKGFKS
ncbi:peroxiredoxin [Asticcacaulis machinosus]|uniref:thioredoxin-dependent peroxiredoxin n=1 Tax=Asticcacaulis machinosus TaxID=2984211 RepID=A0ABT5HEH3_9CAUL|nr:peroxiredoxin [Asticcacaulis machinosus]MDC7674653.1 peroxiredoxin [Asticcacaulis machinosus]